MGHLELVRQDFTSKHEEKQRNKIPYVAYSIKQNKIIYNVTVKDTTIPSVTTVKVDQISETSAIVKCIVTKDGGTPVTKRGLIYGTTSDLTNNVTEIESGKDIGMFEVELKNLNSNTTYYVKAYATNEVGSSYGNVLSFTTNTVDKPIVLSISVDNITDTTATLNGSIIEGSYILERGFVYSSTNTNPTINDYEIQVGKGLGSFSKTLDNLSETTSYYVRSYAVNSTTGVHYSDVVNFITGSSLSNYNYVDLGLPSGTKWATMNIGASKPEDIGYYFAWGEVDPKETFTYDNYKLFDSNGLITKYNSNSDYGIADYKTELDLEDDAAHHIWGKGWKIPTLSQINELGNECTFKNVHYNDTKGVLVTGPNGNSIFLPASGSMNVSSKVGDYGCLQTRTLFNEMPFTNYAFGFQEDEDLLYIAPAALYRYMGIPIRPVIETPLVPSLLNTTIYNISEDSADVSCDIQSNGSLIDKGVVISTKNKPTITNGTKISCNAGKDSLECHLSNLIPNTTYYVRTYAINDLGTGYGYELTFTTKSLNANGYSYVDLGLPSGMLWATCNVGANNPEEYGDYFAWGEVQPKSNYDWSTYKWCNGSETTLTKYNTDSSYGTVDNQIQLELSDDAARANWGGGWRTPAISEIFELIQKCQWEESTENSVKGYKVTGTNGNSIFLPLSGVKLGAMLYENDIYGYYQTSFTQNSVPNTSYLLDITNEQNKLVNLIKCYGLTIRPVLGNQPICEPVLVSVNTDEVISNDNTITVTYDISASKPVSIEEAGVIYSNSQSNPLITNSRYIGPSDLGQSTVVLNDMSYNSNYYVRAYAIYDNKIYYGNTITIRTDLLCEMSISCEVVGDYDADFNLNYKGSSVEEVGLLIDRWNPKDGTATRIPIGTYVGGFKYTWSGDSKGVWYACPYMIQEGNIFYGDIISFELPGLKGSEPTDYLNGHGYVDLGLPSGTMWATMNIGAEKTEDIGDCFAWGEVDPKNDESEHTWESYKWCNGTYDSLTKYNTDSDYGTVDNKTQLDPEDDAAAVNWGGTWRIPTFEQMKELVENCNIETDPDNFNKRLVSKHNGNSIVWIVLGTLLSEIDERYPDSALYCTQNLDYNVQVSREHAMPIRPVCTV